MSSVSGVLMEVIYLGELLNFIRIIVMYTALRRQLTCIKMVANITHAGGKRGHNLIASNEAFLRCWKRCTSFSLRDALVKCDS